VNRYHSPVFLPAHFFEPPEDPPHTIDCANCDGWFDATEHDGDTCPECGPICEVCGTVGADVIQDGGTMIDLAEDGHWCSFCDAKFKLEEASND